MHTQTHTHIETHRHQFKWNQPQCIHSLTVLLLQVLTWTQWAEITCQLAAVFFLGLREMYISLLLQTLRACLHHELRPVTHPQHQRSSHQTQLPMSHVHLWLARHLLPHSEDCLCLIYKDHLPLSEPSPLLCPQGPLSISTGSGEENTEILKGHVLPNHTHPGAYIFSNTYSFPGVVPYSDSQGPHRLMLK